MPCTLTLVTSVPYSNQSINQYLHIQLSLRQTESGQTLGRLHTCSSFCCLRRSARRLANSATAGSSKWYSPALVTVGSVRLCECDCDCGCGGDEEEGSICSLIISCCCFTYCSSCFFNSRSSCLDMERSRAAPTPPFVPLCTPTACVLNSFLASVSWSIRKTSSNNSLSLSSSISLARSASLRPIWVDMFSNSLRSVARRTV